MYLNNAFVLNEISYSRIYLPLIEPKFNTEKYGFNSIRYRGSRLWNNLDNGHRNSNNLDNGHRNSNNLDNGHRNSNNLDNGHRNSNKLKEWEPNCTGATSDMCI